MTLSLSARAFLVPACLALACPWTARASDELAPGTAIPVEPSEKTGLNTGIPFFDDITVAGNLYFFQRKRTRRDLETGRYRNNLDHATVNVGADLDTGLIGEIAGFNFGVFGARDLYSNASPYHEMAFFPNSNPFHPDWSATRARYGFSLYKGYLRLEPGPFRVKLGYFQSTEPNTLGNLWGLMPGTWRGGEAGATFGDLTLGFAVADAYKAPWFKSMNRFLKADGTTGVPFLWSAGARYTVPDGLLEGANAEIAYGRSSNYLMNAHVKTDWSVGVGGIPATFGYQIYLMNDTDDTGGPNDLFEGLAHRHYAFAHLDLEPWSLALEGTWTRAPQNRSKVVNGSTHQLGYHTYRLIDRYGLAKGAIDPWWDCRSDWNHDGEWAVFAGLSRALDDLGLTGLEAGVSGALGWGGRSVLTSRKVREWAVSLDLGAVVPEGPLEGTSVRLHFTTYHNLTGTPDWTPFGNLFQSEQDIKFLVHIPVGG